MTPPRSRDSLSRRFAGLMDIRSGYEPLLREVAVFR